MFFRLMRNDLQDLTFVAEFGEYYLVIYHAVAYPSFHKHNSKLQ